MERFKDLGETAAWVRISALPLMPDYVFGQVSSHPCASVSASVKRIIT